MLAKLPTRIVLTGYGALLDGGTITFDANTEAGEHVKIRLNQHMLNGAKDPGRLFFNGHIVDVRSEYEKLLLSLLESAEVQIEEGPRPDTTPNYIGPPIEIIEAETKANINGVNEYRTVLIDFVRSERYVEISENGIQ